MRIGFTGHRDRHTDESELDRIATAHPGGVWVHGGAIGFDTQVDEYAKAHKLPKPVVMKPEYDKYPAYVAPLLRNEDIVDTTSILVACFDNRKRGGTVHTINYAKRQGKPAIYVTCIP